MSAMIGFYLHFGFIDMLEMTLYEIERFYKIAGRVQKEQNQT